MPGGFEGELGHFLSKLDLEASGSFMSDQYSQPELYRYLHYGTPYVSLSPGDHDLAEAQGDEVGSNSVKSLKVGPGFKVTLYTKPGQSGGKKVFTASTPDIGPFKDRVQSVRVERV